MPGEELLVNRAPEELHKGITTTPASKSASLGASRQAYTAWRKKKSRKCVGLPDMMLLACGVMALMIEVLEWMDAGSSFRKHRQERSGVGVTLYISD